MASSALKDFVTKQPPEAICDLTRRTVCLLSRR
jgi:hypothetical protein